MKWVVAETYSFPYEAQIAKTQLEAAGIPARIENEHTINMDWLYSNALGGIRLLVPGRYLEQAQALLTQDFSQELEQEFGLSERCPQCGSTDIKPYTEGKRPAYLVFLLLGFPLFSYKHGTKCQQCQHFWS
ncbi:DUF2007 domain-containing protein [Acinetobacter courvalinii]|uniref:DUF2007 domain-containing protein n=1 Tax=Acinetobacter courvalinii TaxID=280147 RepID=A0AA42IB36_9GAMM|nr:DUF2007 domain-containing protein [Acinetobacter courvalinii]MDH0565484.1 DUF2007 domain-containing protein [Acinetobacter courvalinii]